MSVASLFALPSLHPHLARVQIAPEQQSAAGQAEHEAHREALRLLQEQGFEPLVGGAYALKTHTGIWRDTKDLDLFHRNDQVVGALQALARAGYRTVLSDPHWFASA